MEADRAWHRRMIGILDEGMAAAMVAGYRAGLYDEQMGGWDRDDFEMAVHAWQTMVKARRTESLWMKGAEEEPAFRLVS